MITSMRLMILKFYVKLTANFLCIEVVPANRFWRLYYARIPFKDHGKSTRHLYPETILTVRYTLYNCAISHFRSPRLGINNAILVPIYHESFETTNLCQKHCVNSLNVSKCFKIMNCNGTDSLRHLAWEKRGSGEYR